MVNGKNAFGGYTGQGLFAYLVADGKVWFAGGGNEFERMIAPGWCS
jgi:hypothetical protein